VTRGGLGTRRQARRLFAVAEVERQRPHGDAGGRAHLLGDGVESVLTSRGEHQVHPSPSQCHRDVPTDSSRSSGDQRDVSAANLHAYSLFSAP
jgi:hypothetical protein